MCGIAGVLSLGQAPLAAQHLKAMMDVVAHRGPDDAGYLVWQTGRQHPRGMSHGQAFTDADFRHVSPELPSIDSTSGRELLGGGDWDLFLGHRRLAILDLSSRGHQPMSEGKGEIWLTYNGEIYNFRELRDELLTAGHVFGSRTDTEVILHAYREWGTDCVRRLNGMFAFALWDDRRKRLVLARDRYGIKPLYYSVAEEFIFGSELKSILEYLPRRPEVDLLALNEYFSFQNILSDRTLLSGIKMLPPGSIMTVDASAGNIKIQQYWDFDFSQESEAPEADLQEKLYELIRQAVERQCVSDVPVGSYLSGGMDSGTITALTAKHFGRITTFTLGFDLSEAAEHEMQFDERELAERMSSLFQTEHYECVLHAGDMAAVMDKLVWHLEDLRVGQCYPNYYVARLASRFAKVVMSGTGGDELFGGYPWRYAAAVGDTHADYVHNYYRYWKRLVRNRDKPGLFHPDVSAQLRCLDDDGAVPFRDHTLTVFKRVLAKHERPDSLASQVSNSLYFECKTFLHGLLVVEDKLSMAHSLETRVPLLDNDLVDLACRIPISCKVAGLDSLKRVDENLPRKKQLYAAHFSRGKNILRKAMESILPPVVVNARKQGFSAPDESWFRGQAEDYVRERLLDPSAEITRYVNPAYIAQVIDEHSSGIQNRRLLIWSLLSFEAWLPHFQ